MLSGEGRLGHGRWARHRFVLVAQTSYCQCLPSLGQSWPVPPHSVQMLEPVIVRSSHESSRAPRYATIVFLAVSRHVNLRRKRIPKVRRL